ncbi:UDP-glucose 4-epimerase [hydrothermal vent metagenome]|uniref:UDP-glucose 4-epimerase n=1 Tax=hydrothermal vent metagenome TaxID=652676 RepID=A0A3B0V2U8_9ZZZZ
MNNNREIENSTVLVTGGAGFIGSNLIDNLLNQNNKVVCLDNFSTGKKENIAHQLNNSKFTLIEGDIRHVEDCQKACNKVDYVLHQAALGSVPRSIKDPITTNEVNITGFLNMLIAARDNKVKRVVYAASSSTYGDHPELPKVEDKIGKPLSPYAVTKYVNELYADVFYKTYGLETIGLRYFNVFGRRQDPNGAYAAVIPKFIDQLINLKSPTINGDGKTSRDFTYIDNVIQINQLAALTSSPKAINKVFNVAVGGRVSLIEMFEELKKNLGIYKNEIAHVNLIFGPERAGDVKHSQADISLATNLLGYNPKFDFESGISKYVDWYWNNKI